MYNTHMYIKIAVWMYFCGVDLGPYSVLHRGYVCSLLRSAPATHYLKDLIQHWRA